MKLLFWESWRKVAINQTSLKLPKRIPTEFHNHGTTKTKKTTAQMMNQNCSRRIPMSANTRSWINHNYQQLMGQKMKFPLRKIWNPKLPLYKDLSPVCQLSVRS